MIETTYFCDGCGASSSAQQASDWKTALPVHVEVHLRANSPLQSQFCGCCWQVAIDAVHSRVLDPSPAAPPATQLIDMTDRLPTAEIRAQLPPVTR